MGAWGEVCGGGRCVGGGEWVCKFEKYNYPLFDSDP